MTIIDSANMQCNSCGVSANHPIMYMPEGWIVDRSVEPIQHFCSMCKYYTGLHCQTCTHDKGEHIGDNFKCISCSFCKQFVDPRQPSNWVPRFFQRRRSTDYQTMPTVDPVNHPSHYTSHPSGVECIQIVEWMSFNVGNAVKYLWRADEKGSPLEDLEKAAWYITREIERRKSG